MSSAPIDAAVKQFEADVEAGKWPGVVSLVVHFNNIITLFLETFFANIVNFDAIVVDIFYFCIVTEI